MKPSATVKFGRDGKKVYFLGDREVSKKAYDAAFPDKEIGEPLAAHLPACWPMRSEALACHPEQAGEMNDRNRKAGIAATYDGDGICVIASRKDRAKLNKLEGFHDKQGGYSD